MERSARNVWSPSSNRKLYATFASPNRYFTENSRWVSLLPLNNEKYISFVLLPQASEPSMNFASNKRNYSSVPKSLFTQLFREMFWEGCKRLSLNTLWVVYSVTICEQKQRIVHGQGASKINYSTVIFNFYFAGFPNQSPLLTIVFFLI